MTTIIRWATITLLLSTIAFSPAFAGTHSYMTAGFGLGGHAFSKIDGVREEGSLFNEMKYGALFNFYLEWFDGESLGMGWRKSYVTSTMQGSLGLEKNVLVENTLVTLLWAPLGAGDSVLFGVMAGLGCSEYTVTIYNGGTSKSSTSGVAVLLGVYLDWAREGLGARLGAHRLQMDLEPLNGVEVDGSGTAIHAEINYKFF